MAANLDEDMYIVANPMVDECWEKHKRLMAQKEGE